MEASLYFHKTCDLTRKHSRRMCTVRLHTVRPGWSPDVSRRGDPKSDVQVGHQMSIAGGGGTPGLMSGGGDTPPDLSQRGRRGTLPCDLSHYAFDVTYPPEACENITNPQLHLRVVINIITITTCSFVTNNVSAPYELSQDFMEYIFSFTVIKNTCTCTSIIMESVCCKSVLR